MPQDTSKTTEGWHLITRYWLAVLKDHKFCTVCGGIADKLWDLRDRRGKCLEVIPVCGKHADRFERDADDPRLLTRTDTTAPRGMVITCGELADYLHHCHFIAHQRGLKSASHWKFTLLSHPDLMKQLQALRAVKRSDHFSGWEPREGFIQATLLRNGTWEALIKVGTSEKKVVVRLR